MKNEGYLVNPYMQPVKRYCQTLDLRDDPALIEEYKRRHRIDNTWPEINEGIRTVGILRMEIYIQGTRLFMIVETPIDFDWQTAMAKLATLPRQAEWESYMSDFQLADPKQLATEKWQLMEQMFLLE